MWAHLGNNFVLDFHEDELRDVQAAPGNDHRPLGPFVPGVDVPPPDQQPRRRQQLLPAGDDRRRTLAQVRLSLAQRALDEPQPSRRLHRRALHQRRGRLGRHLARPELRVAPQHQRALHPGHLHQEPLHAEHRRPLRHPGRRGAGGGVPANPFFPTLMPAIDFKGADAGVVWKDFSPRVGFTYDLKGNGRNVFSSSYATYYGQMAPGPAVEPARRHRRGVRPLSLDRHQRRRLRAGAGSQHHRHVPEQEHRLRSGQPDQHHVADARRSERQERPHARVHRWLRPSDRTRTMAVGASYVWRKYRSVPLERSRQLDRAPTTAR